MKLSLNRSRLLELRDLSESNLSVARGDLCWSNGSLMRREL